MADLNGYAHNNGNGGTWGLKGPWGQAAQLTAVGLLCLMFYQGFHAGLDALKEERALMRQAVARIEASMDAQTASIQEQTRAIRELTQSRKRGQND